MLDNENLMVSQINKWLQSKVEAYVEAEIEEARERLKAKIPQLVAEMGLHLQQGLRRDPMNLETYLQILIRPKL